MENRANDAIVGAKGKRHSLTRRTAIIGGVVLMLLLFVGLAFPCLGGCALESARKAQASTMTSQFEVACTMYKTEYGSYPSTSENHRLYEILNGREVAGNNPRHIQFMSFNPKETSPNNEILDPWKTPYRILFDDKGVLVISAGPDKLFGTKDDITNRK